MISYIWPAPNVPRPRPGINARQRACP